MSKNSLNFKALILCDEIRRENNGKLFFIGVYPENVIAYKFPANLGFSFCIVAETSEIESLVEIDIALKPSNAKKKKSIARAEMKVIVNDKNSFKQGKAQITLILDRLPVTVEEISEIIISWKESGGRFREIDARSIILSPDSTIEQQQPS